MEDDLEKLAYEWLHADADQADVQSEHYCRTRDVFQNRSEKMLADLLRKSGISEDQAYIISAIAGEIGNNSFDHNVGNWPDIMGIFFTYFFVENKLRIILADRGQGVLATLRRVKPELADDVEALKVAFTQKISGRAPENRGNGLKFVKTGVQNSHFHLVFISGSAQADLNETAEFQKWQSAPIRGCLAILST
jgi:anti-sigma regulatory factor (Ser/Thr protein kinase)